MLEWPTEPLRGRYQDLGTLAGSVEIGVGRFMPAPGNQSSPAHVEGGEEEIAFILSGSGWSWQDGATFEVGAGDTLVYRREEASHTLVAGDDGLDALVFGERAYAGATHLVRAGIVRIVDTWVEALGPPHPYEREAAAGAIELGPPQPRPDRIVALSDVEPVVGLMGGKGPSRRDLGRAAGSVTTGLKHIEVAPGDESAPPHVHSAEEELFVVLGGSGVARIGEDVHPVERGSVVARPAGDGLAHHFVAGDEGLELLAYGQRRSSDIIWYPRSRKLSVAGLGVIFRVEETLEYWDGEP